MNATAESYIIGQASLRARLLCATAGFRPDEIDDARQELLLDYLRRLPKFDSGRGDWDGFVRGVMRNQTAVLVARRHRRVRHEVLAGDLGDSESEGPDGEVFGDGCRRDEWAGLDASIDVRRVVRRLPGHLQTLAYLLTESSISEIILATGRSRSTIYKLRRQLREAFVRAGLNPHTMRRTRQPRCAPPSGGRV